MMASTAGIAQMVEKMVDEMQRALTESIRVEYGVQTELRDEVTVDIAPSEELAIELAANYHPSWKAQVVRRTVICTPWAPHEADL